MALIPININRSTMVTKRTKRHTFVSTSFIANFDDGSVKILNIIKKYTNSLFDRLYIPIDLTTVRLNNDKSTLYYRDWTNVQSYQNNFHQCYPSIIT